MLPRQPYALQLVNNICPRKFTPFSPHLSKEALFLKAGQMAERLSIIILILHSNRQASTSKV
jgi:hypothetical protein